MELTLTPVQEYPNTNNWMIGGARCEHSLEAKRIGGYVAGWPLVTDGCIDGGEGGRRDDATTVKEAESASWKLY